MGLRKGSRVGEKPYLNSHFDTLPGQPPCQLPFLLEIRAWSLSEPAGEELKSLLSCEHLCLLSSPRESDEHTLPVHCPGHHQCPTGMVQMCPSSYRRGKGWNKRTFRKVVSSLDHCLRFWGQNRNKVMTNRQSGVCGAHSVNSAEFMESFPPGAEEVE